MTTLLMCDDIIADCNANSKSIFSFPVDMTLAKKFTGDAWTVKPSLDLTLTGNFGNDKAESTVHWVGVDNLSTNGVLWGGQRPHLWCNLRCGC